MSSGIKSHSKHFQKSPNVTQSSIRKNMHNYRKRSPPGIYQNFCTLAALHAEKYKNKLVNTVYKVKQLVVYVHSTQFGQIGLAHFAHTVVRQV